MVRRKNLFVVHTAYICTGKDDELERSRQRIVRWQDDSANPSFGRRKCREEDIEETVVDRYGT
jgi:hypothetical protein